MIRVAFPTFLLFMLAACGDNSSVAAGDADRGAPPTTAVIAENGPAPVVEYGGPGPIPAPLHGSWATTPADCDRPTAGPDDFVEVQGDELVFRGATARPTGDAETGDQSIRGTFAFEEGERRWTRFQSLQVQEDKLVRTESEPMASYTYARCR